MCLSTSSPLLSTSSGLTTALMSPVEWLLTLCVTFKTFFLFFSWCTVSLPDVLAQLSNTSPYHKCHQEILFSTIGATCKNDKLQLEFLSKMKKTWIWTALYIVSLQIFLMGDRSINSWNVLQCWFSFLDFNLFSHVLKWQFWVGVLMEWCFHLGIHKSLIFYGIHAPKPLGWICTFLVFLLVSVTL